MLQNPLSENLTHTTLLHEIKCFQLRFPVARTAWRFVAAILFCIAPLAAPTHAGLAASDIILVVNGQSQDSRTLANHYVALRAIPAQNVVVLDNVPDAEKITVDAFREKILRPIIAEIDTRKLGSHVQCIAYSADFPTAIDISSDLKNLGKLSKIYTKVASINALTFHYQFVLESNPSYINLASNRYACRPMAGYFTSPAGPQTADQWKAILDLIVDTEHAAAAAALEELLKSHPHQFPMAYLAAAQYAQAEMPKEATQMLRTAVAAGWSNGHFLAADKRFDALRDTMEFQVIELTLNDNTSGQSRAYGFDAKATWTPNGVRTKNPKLGFRYLLSTVLGVTRGQGTTLQQAIESLQRSASADSTHPTGAFYFTSTSDVRTTERQPGFQTAIELLQDMGHDASIVKSALPQNAPSVLGAQIGVASFDWSTSASKFAPGAIADNLTSLGGVMNSSSQTKLTALISAGASGSSGTVTEPYALQAKFPHPQMYVHYARGASLAEAFYLSVTGPYQLLIVGDPLCQPFSNAPNPKIDTQRRTYKTTDSLVMQFNDGSPKYTDWLAVSGNRATKTIALRPTAISLLSDGINPRSGKIQSRVALKLSGLTPGYHELTVRLVADDPLSQRRDILLPIVIDDAQTVSVKVGLAKSPIESPPAGVAGSESWYTIAPNTETFQISVTATGAKRIKLLHESEELASIQGETTMLEVPTASLGFGPIRLRLRAEMPDGSQRQSLPIILNRPPAE